MSKFYHFRQNNSGGRWVGPVNVIVEANSATEANDRAEEHAGIYFYGCRDSRDCDCCGDRWHRVYESDASDVPSIYGEPAAEECPDALVYCLDGRVVEAKDWVATVDPATELLKRVVEHADTYNPPADEFDKIASDIRSYLSSKDKQG
jgi:hypothetical protein